MSRSKDYLHEYRLRTKATQLQRRGNRMTMARYHGAIPLSVVLATTRPSWTTAIANAGLWETDRKDGKNGKGARKLWPELPRTRASTLDPDADKRLQYGNRFAIFARACASGDWGSATVMAAETAVSAVRDRRMAQHRELAARYDVPTDATDVNRVKTAAVALGEVVALSPLAEHPTVRKAALATICAGTIIGIAGAELYGAQVREHIRELG